MSRRLQPGRSPCTLRSTFPIFALLIAFASTAVALQSLETRFARNEEAVREVLPAALTFSVEDGRYKHIRGYAAAEDGSEPALVGYVFFTEDLGARYRGYIGRIPIIVGLDLQGRLTGIHIMKHFEPYGYRSINLPEYAAQFSGKSVLDRFEIGNDIDAYAGATITVTAARSVRHAARQMAREFLIKKTEGQE